MELYQARFRGIAEYYKYAIDRWRLGKLKYVMEEALVKTLAQKVSQERKQDLRKISEHPHHQ